MIDKINRLWYNKGARKDGAPLFVCGARVPGKLLKRETAF